MTGRDRPPPPPSSRSKPTTKIPALEDDILIEELKSTVRSKIGVLKGDLRETGEKLDYERYLREEADRRARYFEQKANLVDMYDTGNESTGVRQEMQDRLSPMKRRQLREGRGSGYDTVGSAYASDTQFKLPRSRRRVYESDFLETTEAETTDIDGGRSRFELNRARRRTKPPSNRASPAASDTESKRRHKSVGGPVTAPSPALSYKRTGGGSRKGSRRGSVGDALDVDDEYGFLEEELAKNEERRMAMQHELTALKHDNAELAYLLSEVTHLQGKLKSKKTGNLVLVDGKFRDAESDLKNLRAMQELKDEEVSAKVAARVADVIEEVYKSQQQRDEALTAQLKNAHAEREQLMEQINNLQQQNALLQKTPDKRVSSLVADDSSPSIAELLDAVERASSGLEVEQAGGIIVERMLRANQAAERLRAEEMNCLIEERDNATNKLKEMEAEIFSSDKFAAQSRDSTGGSRVDSRVNRALKAELQQVSRDRDQALIKVQRLEDEIASIKQYLRENSDGTVPLDELQRVMSQQGHSQHLESLAQDLADKLRAAESARDQAQHQLEKHRAETDHLHSTNQQN